ncbi:hypothetical protein TYRP_000438 [Tyrophagus putrescentiae]|nr:hypothetical protein TYRP_000438 [Tyrophagus putrescentiae]
MPCALSASIMSSKYAQEGNQRGFSVSTTSGNEMNEEQTKSNNSSTSAEGSVHQVLPVSFRDNATSSLPTTSRSQHSFSIEALVGNNRSHDDDASKPAGTSIPEIASSESWPNQHPLVDLKRIQAYYQQMYSQHFPLKQLNNYLYPLASFTESEASKPNEPAREKDQILAYYANLYLQSSNFYQERYLESLRTFSTDTVQQNSKESIPEFLQRYEKQIIKNEPEEVAQSVVWQSITIYSICKTSPIFGWQAATPTQQRQTHCIHHNWGRRTALDHRLEVSQMFGFKTGAQNINEKSISVLASQKTIL